MWTWSRAERTLPSRSEAAAALGPIRERRRIEVESATFAVAPEAKKTVEARHRRGPRTS
jgi:hypothetical protein